MRPNITNLREGYFTNKVSTNNLMSDKRYSINTGYKNSSSNSISLKRLGMLLESFHYIVKADLVKVKILDIKK